MTRTTTTRTLLATLAVAVIAAGCGSDQTTRDDAGVIVEGGDLGVFSATTGDCVNVPDGVEISEFEGVACTEPHDAQVYAAFDLPDGVFPGLESVRASADEGCSERWDAFFEIEYARSEYFSTRVTPTMESWNKIDDREILCLVTTGPNDEPLTEDLRGYGADLVDEVVEVVEDDPVDDETTTADAGDTPAVQDLAELVSGAGPLVVDGTLAANSTAGYSLVMESGQSIGVTLTSQGRPATALSDPVLVVLNAAGVEVAANDDADGLNSALVYTAATNGSYTIVAGDLSDLGGDFQLAVELVDAGAQPSIGVVEVVESDVSGSLVAELTVGAASTVSTSQSLEAGTYDVVQLTVDAPVSAIITVTGGGVLDTQLVVTSEGSVVAENDDASNEADLPSVLDSQVIVDLDAGVYELEVRSYGDVGEGDYSIEIVTN